MDYHQLLVQYFGHPHTQTGDYSYFDLTIYAVKDLISMIGTFVIFSGVLMAISRYILIIFKLLDEENPSIDIIRLKLGQTIALGLEFIVAADVIETTTAPDYYTVGILCSVVFIRTFLNYFLNREIDNLATLSLQQRQNLK